MKTTYQIKVAYNKAMGQADKIDGIAADVEKKRQKLADAGRKLAGYWSGNNANAYQARMGQKETELSGIVADLRNIAETIRGVAGTTYKADMKAVQIAQQKAKQQTKK